MASRVNSQERNLAQGFPNILVFESNIEKGADLHTWKVKPYSDGEWFADRGKIEETTSIVGKTVFAGAITGSTVCNIVHFTKSLMQRFVPHVARVTGVRIFGFGIMVSGPVFGGALGLIFGIYATHRYYVDRPLVINATQNYSDKSRQIIAVFVSSYLNSRQDKDDIICPISKQTMIYPVKTGCGSKEPHVYEYLFILERLGNNPRSKCELCDGEPQIKNLTRCKATEERVKSSIAFIFTRMEGILRHLPKRCFGSGDLPNFSERHLVAELVKSIDAKKFFTADIQTIAEKIKHPSLLTKDEAYPLAYFLIHQFKPMKEKVDRIYRNSVERLTALSGEEKIDKSTHRTQLAQLESWHSEFDIIPRECKIIRTLYKR